MANFGGTARFRAVGFSIGIKGYIGTGQDGSGDRNDFWEWNQSTNIWTQKANFPGTARSGAVGFSIGTKGYIGTGSGTSDFYEWDQSTNVWTAKTSYPSSLAFPMGDARSASTGFGITSTSKGYLGGAGLDGNSNFTSHFYEYSQATNTWTAKASPPFGSATSPCKLRYYAVAFAIGTKGYLGTGAGCAGEYFNTWYEYDPAGNTWTQKANYTVAASAVENATGFSIGTKGYIVTGDDPTGSYPLTFYEYNQGTNTWSTKANFGGTGRQGAVSFSIGTCGYVGTGLDATGFRNDFWEWSPGASCSVTLPITLLSFTGEAKENETVLLKWSTANEENNNYFTVERSNDGILFTELERLDGSGNSTTTKNYSMADHNPYPHLTYYRLKQTDFDGKSTYSNIITVPTESSIIYAGPSPAYDNFNLKFISNDAGIAYLEIFDVTGKNISKNNFQRSKGENSIQLNVNTFSPGLYFIRICTPSVQKQLKFVKL